MNELLDLLLAVYEERTLIKRRICRRAQAYVPVAEAQAEQRNDTLRTALIRRRINHREANICHFGKMHAKMHRRRPDRIDGVALHDFRLLLLRISRHAEQLHFDICVGDVLSAKYMLSGDHLRTFINTLPA